MFNNLFRRRDDEEKLKNQGRLPPGQSITDRFPVLHYGPVPAFNPAAWDFKVSGEVEAPLRLSWEEFQKLPRTQLVMDIHCVTRWSKFDTVWKGVHIRTLVEQGLVRLKPEAKFVLQIAEYGFTANVPLEIALQDNFLLATHYNGEPITPEHGYPLRGIVGAIPGRADLTVPYFWKGAKWLRGLQFLREDRLGFWEQAGYHNEADVWKEQRYA